MHSFRPLEPMHRWPHSSGEQRSQRIAKRRSSARWISPSWGAGSRDWEPHGPSLASIASPSSRPITGWEATPTPSTSTTEAGRSLSIQASSSTTSGTTPTWCGCSNTSGFRPSGATCRSRSRKVAGRSSTRRARSGCSRSRPTWLVAATGAWSPTSCGSHGRRPPLLRSATGRRPESSSIGWRCPRNSGETSCCR